MAKAIANQKEFSLLTMTLYTPIGGGNGDEEKKAA